MLANIIAYWGADEYKHDLNFVDVIDFPKNKKFGFIKRVDKGSYHRERFRKLTFRALALRQSPEKYTIKPHLGRT